MVEVNSKEKCPEDSLAAAQLEKMNLEIEQLKNKKEWEKRLALYTPLLSVLIAVGGFLFGIYQFQRQQYIQQNQLIAEQQKEREAKETEQAIRIQNQIRLDVEQILQFPNDKQQTISNVSFLLEDLKGYLELAAGKSQTAQSQNNKRSVSVTLVSSVVNDCNFDQLRDINYVYTITQWEDYGRYLEKEGASSLEFILSKYNEALKNIYAKDPAVIRSVRYVEDEHSISYPIRYGKLNADQVYHFQNIVGGFTRYLGFLKDEKAREKHLIRFQAAMCNGTLMKQLFGVKFSHQSDPEEFAHCPK